MYSSNVIHMRAAELYQRTSLTQQSAKQQLCTLNNAVRCVDCSFGAVSMLRVLLYLTDYTIWLLVDNKKNSHWWLWSANCKTKESLEPA